MKGNEEYVKFSEAPTLIKLGKLQIKMQDLFKGDKVLSEVGDAIINQNIDNFIVEIEPKVQQSIGKRKF